MRAIILTLGILTLIFVEILRVYFIMPFPGSQEDDTIQLAYFLGNNITYVRLLGILLIAGPAYYYFKNGSQIKAITLTVVLGFYGVVFYMFNYKFLADKMFLEMKRPEFTDAQKNNKVLPEQLVVGITIGNDSRAYPIEIIGYHHQVRDTVGGQLVMVTYCTVCRTGRVFSPMVDGKPEKFRLVGMDHFNAMFEDSQTKSWWRQVNGEAIAGPLKGKTLVEIPSEQMSLANWISQHAETKILQPDSLYKGAYASLKNYDEGTKLGSLERKDSLSWTEKSWVVGVQVGSEARAYDWIELVKTRVINDELGGVPIMVVLGPDLVSFHVFDRRIGTETVLFQLGGGGELVDAKTQSIWNWNGESTSGQFQGKVLTPIQSYQEYWHSWRTFRPQTTKFTFASNP